MKIQYRGVELDLAPAAIKAWTEIRQQDDDPRQQIVGISCDGDACLVHTYIVDQLVNHGVFDFAVNVNYDSIKFESRGQGDDDYLLVKTDAPLADLILGFDDVFGEGEYQVEAHADDALYLLRERGVW